MGRRADRREHEAMPLAEPQLVAVIEFLEWTLDNHLRHPKFVGLRDDVVASQVTR